MDPGQITVDPSAPRLQPGRDPAILWRDPHFAVVWKPPGFLAVPAPRAGGHKSVLGAVKRALGEALPVHRLDEGTSGLMMVARTPAAQEALKDLLERHEIERRYLAIVQGHPPDRPTTRHSWLLRDRGDGLRGSTPAGTQPEGSKEAITHLRLVEALGPKAALVEARLETGRTHQVRIHLAELGHPLLGDPLYAPRPVAARAPRLALHAAVLGLQHPMTREALRFEIPLADDLAALAEALRAGSAPPVARRRRR